MDGIQTRIIESGVPQGSVLGPLLWNLTFDKVLQANMEKGCRLIAYADDTLILAIGSSYKIAKERAMFQIARTVNEIKNLQLEIATQKTEIVVFIPSRKAPPKLEIVINNKVIRSQRKMKYLGVIVDDKLTFKEHLEYVTDKVNKVTRALWRLMPNLHGPTERKRRLYTNVLASIILYAAPVWAHEAKKKGEVRNLLKVMHKNITQRVIAAYKTVALDAAALLTRIPPYYMIAEERKRSYEKLCEIKLTGEWTERKGKEVQEEKANMYRKWKRYLEDNSQAGKRTREAILPVWESWLGRKHGMLSFHLTQLLTGHGVFFTYLKRIKKAD